jgi:hypothetical protein
MPAEPIPLYTHFLDLGVFNFHMPPIPANYQTPRPARKHGELNLRLRRQRGKVAHRDAALFDGYPAAEIRQGVQKPLLPVGQRPAAPLDRPRLPLASMPALYWAAYTVKYNIFFPAHKQLSPLKFLQDGFLKMKFLKVENGTGIQCLRGKIKK